MKHHLPFLTALLFISVLSANAQPVLPPSPLPTITVQGRAEVRIPNTEASIQLGCEAASANEADVRNDLATRAQAITEVLKNENVSRLQTSSLNIHPQFSNPPHAPNEPPQTPKIIGYNGRVILSFVTPVSESGRIISAALQAGANSVVSTQTQPTDEARTKAENEVLALAAKDAETQARTLINTLGLTWDGIREINASGNSTPFPSPRSVMMTAAAPASPEFEVLAGDTAISREVTLQAVFKNP